MLVRPLRMRVRICLVLCLVSGAAGRVVGAPDLAVHAVEAVGLTVSDMDRALDFYTRVLPFEVVADTRVAGHAYGRLLGVGSPRLRVVRLRLGDETLVLTDFLAPEGRSIPADSRSDDHWFQHVAIIVSDMDRAYEHLRAHKVQHVSPGPQTLPDWNPNAGGIRAFYCRDPDGHALEVLWFPPDKGDPRWHRATARLFLGIDHTAIVVADTDASLHFYSDLLGMRVVGRSENYGAEQERLNGVFGARLRITALRAASGPGIEFLEYLAPPGGRPRPPGARANDLLHWQTTVLVGNAAAAEKQLRAGGATLVSPGTVSTPDAALGFARSFLVRDPDGHVLHLVEPMPEGAAWR